MRLNQYPVWNSGDFWNLWRQLDKALILAALVEVPRWSVAFLAIHEPWIFGVPLAIIITWSMQAGWSRFFKKGGNLILALDLLALTIAVAIITPVLYLMTEPTGATQQILFMSIPVVNISNFSLQDMNWVKLFWSFCLALSTFLPLIGLAAVSAANEQDKHEENKAKPSAPQPKPLSEFQVTLLDAQAAPLVKATQAAKPTLSVPARSKRDDESYNQAKAMLENGATKTEVANAINVTTRTLRNWFPGAANTNSAGDKQ